MAELKVKQEPIESSSTTRKTNPSEIPVINLDEDDSDTDDYSNNNGKKRVNSGGGGNEKKRTRLPAGFLDPLPRHQVKVVDRCSKQFWKAGDFDDVVGNGNVADSGTVVSAVAPRSTLSPLYAALTRGQTATHAGVNPIHPAGLTYLVPTPHPRRLLPLTRSLRRLGQTATPSGTPGLQANAQSLSGITTAHSVVQETFYMFPTIQISKQTFAELLDNSLDEVCNGATYVKIDMLTNKKDDSRILLIEDNGGGMDPEKMRHCMSLGYSLKSKVKDTIGQYGNGFKTSTMRLGADVIVFSRCSGKDGKRLVDPSMLSTQHKSDRHREVCGMDHLRVHPRFLHSNATSHKWVLGAFAELLDNSLDEVCNGATYVKIDMLTNKKDDSRILLIEDNGGGMDPEKMRHCMSLGYSLKSKVKDTIGQYGNGFKTSTMRLGADVIVFSRCSGKDGKRATQSIGLLSYTFLRCTGKEDIVVPMLDYERPAKEWKKMKRVSASDWEKNVEAMVEWSPFSSEADLLRQFDHMKDHGTRVIIYNLWEDDQGQLELDFDTDKHDIQIRGVNRDEGNIEMAKQYPNSRHFLTYRHSLRSYAAILYLRVPHNFRMILRGKDVEHHNIINDMMLTNEVTYRPQPGLEGIPKDSNMVAIVTVGFVKDAKSHIDVQGFNVYHKNRLIKPFWRIWNASGSDGRGVIESSPDYEYETPSKRHSAASDRKIPTPRSDKFSSPANQKESVTRPSRHSTGAINGCYGGKGDKSHNRVSGAGSSSSESTSPLNENIRDDNSQTTMTTRHANGTSAYKTPSATTLEVRHRDADHNGFPSVKVMQVATPPHLRSAGANGNVAVASSSSTLALQELMEENRVLKERLKRREDELLGDLLHDLEYERKRCKELEAQCAEEKQKYEALVKEQDSISTIFTEERERRDAEEETLRKKLKEAEITTKDLMEKCAEEKQKYEALVKEQDSISTIFTEERERRDAEEETLRKKLKEAEITTKDLMEKVKVLQLEKMKAMGNKWGQ
ncbi:histidine kinase-like ATPase, C-terminal domain-containing protein [Artemisia annua]|uniref:Histidine kinase-like ATPase, C-terminal domain-containing protein n=1 Tax=Artemisia annua TaxID=35608 RepID=A0A2U1NTT4_ARTAN|nr:histidine kinase-like ATPase, C-terminal domain-containing protein [Artemisia annua]